MHFHHAEARLTHRRLTGSSDANVFKGRTRLGQGIWFMGYYLLYALASGIFRMRERPYVIGKLSIIVSYLYAAIRQEPRFDDREFIQEVQRRQLEQLKKLPRTVFGRTESLAQ